jgi:hypothetical protein
MITPSGMLCLSGANIHNKILDFNDLNVVKCSLVGVYKYLFSNYLIEKEGIGFDFKSNLFVIKQKHNFCYIISGMHTSEIIRVLT